MFPRRYTSRPPSCFLRFWIPIATLLLPFCMAGCGELAYYGQAASGQLSLLSGAEDIPVLLQKPDTPAELARKLRLIQEARTFAQRQLALTPGDNYTTYVDTGKPFVLWNISATPAFSLTPKKWCYPVVGCQSYRGYFAQEDAEKAAATLRSEDQDVYVSGVSAYSTLGWFDDPVLNTFVFRSDLDLVTLIFHELAHKVLYIPGDTAFNESFATAVEEAGLQDWLEAHDQSDQYSVYVGRRQHHEAFTRRVLATIKELEALYATAVPEHSTRENWLGPRKEAIIEKMRAGYFEESASWTFKGYDAWFSSPINNAKLITVANYHQYVPHFSSLLRKQRRDFRSFYERAKNLGELPPEARLKMLEEILRERPEE